MRHVNLPGGNWNDERTEMLAKFAANGLSAAKIAEQIGGGVTRNAVIGKMLRLGIKAVIRPKLKLKEPRKVIVRPLPPSLKSSDLSFSKPPTPVQMTALPIFSTPVRIEDLESSMCRWPLGNPCEDSFRYCGAEIVVIVRGRMVLNSYCNGHAALAHVPR